MGDLTMSPTEAWLSAHDEARELLDAARARIVAGNAIQEWQGFLSNRRAELHRRRIEGRA